MLLNPQANRTSLNMFLDNGKELLDRELRQLTRDRADLNFIEKSVCELDRDLEEEADLLRLIRVVHLIKLLELHNEYSLNFLLSCFGRAKAEGKQSVSEALNKAA